MFIHSIAFGTLKKMIGDRTEILDRKAIDMTLDTMSNNLIYWSQDLFQANLLDKGSHILAMTSAGGRKNWQSYGAISYQRDLSIPPKIPTWYPNTNMTYFPFGNLLLVKSFNRCC